MRTPEARFHDLPDYPFASHYVEIGQARLRMHYIDETPADPSGETVLLLHGNPSWSYLYRHVIPPLVAAGHRCVAPDLIGFGKSDKPASRFAYTYRNHLDWLREALFDRLDLREVTLVCHDWGGALGLPLLAAQSGRFRRVVASNTGLSTGEEDLGEGWPMMAAWLQSSQRIHPFEPSKVIDSFTVNDLALEELAAYDAPYPDESYLPGVRQFPLLIPISPQDENTPALREAWAVLESLDIPFLCAFSDQDHITRGDHSALSGRIPGAKGQSHITISNAGHFVQEDQGPAFAAVIAGFIRSTAKKHR
ncbi:haloalkane dehalogenase [Nonomuraea turcica]|uniref:haloalkane dehalogenase n=1 Tax=Nonomuraea sp. G32 TaxID=3067274 RepID=UPI00273B3140|nr:haloalkane dehalogenase [Nonomuraea sp. G32]MDP4505394.1 haloalkane dehalogenase [Nonomuraea sp. G32]